MHSFSRSLCVLAIFVSVGHLAAQSQQEMNQEAREEAEQADKMLNRVYAQVMDVLDTEGAALLKKSQRAWLAYRDTEAAFAADEMRGGSAAPMLYSGTIATLTTERTMRLREILGSPEEDSSSEPEGAETAKKAGELFYKAYANHDREAAENVASRAAIKALIWDPSAGKPEGLDLIDPTHIYYVGGSIEMKIKKNSHGRWYVSALEMTAD